MVRIDKYRKTAEISDYRDWEDGKLVMSTSLIKHSQVLFGVMKYSKISGDGIQLCEYTKNNELYTLKG